MKNTAQCPHIHLRSVPFCPQQQLRSPIVQRSDHIRHRLLRKIQLLRHAQVDDFQMVVVGIDVCRLRLRLRLWIFGNKHDVGRFQVAVDDVQGVKFQCPLDRFAEQLLNGELFLTQDDPIQVCAQPLHDHHGLLLVHEGLDHPRHVFSCQYLVEITLTDEAGREADLTQCLELFHSHRLLGRIVSCSVDHSVGSLLHPLHDGVTVPEGRSLHQLPCDYQLSARLQSPPYYTFPNKYTARRSTSKIEIALGLEGIFMMLGLG